MRFIALLIGLLLMAPIFAQSASSGDKLELCVKNCCVNNGGNWNSKDVECNVTSMSQQKEQNYSVCATECVKKEFGLGCCGPSFILAGVLVLSLFSRKS